MKDCLETSGHIALMSKGWRWRPGIYRVQGGSEFSFLNSVKDALFKG